MGDIYQLKQSFLNESRAILICLIGMPELCEHIYISMPNDKGRSKLFS